MKRTISPVRSLFPNANTTLGDASFNRSTPMSALPPRAGSRPAGPAASAVDQHARSHTPLTLLNRDAVNQSSASSTRADGAPRTSPVRQRATVMFESDDGGQFVVSYDAPQVRRTQPSVGATPQQSVERATFHLDATYTLDGAAADKTTLQLDATFTKTGSCDVVDTMNPLDETLAKGGCGGASNDLENSTFNQTSTSNATANGTDVLEQSSIVGERRLLVPSKNFPKKTVVGLPTPAGGSLQRAADSSTANGTDDEKWGGQEGIADEWSEEGSIQSERSVSTVRSRNEARAVEDRKNTRLNSARGSLIPAPIKPSDRASNLPRRQSFTAATNNRLSTFETPQPTRVNNASGAKAFVVKSGAASGADRRGLSREVAAAPGNLRKRAPSVENLRPKMLSRAPSSESMCSEVSETPSGRSIPVSRVPASESGRDNALRRIPQLPAMSEQVDRRRPCIVERKQSAGAVDRKLTVAPRASTFKEPSYSSATKASLSRTVGCAAVDSNWQKRKEYNPQKAIEEAAMGKPPLSGRSSGRDSGALKLFDSERRPAIVGVPTLRGYVQNSSSLQSHATTGGAAGAAKLRNNVSTSFLQSTPREKPMRVAPPGGYKSASAQRSGAPQASEVKAGRPSVGRAMSNVGSSKLSVATSEKGVAARGGALKSCLKTAQAPRASQESVNTEDGASNTSQTPSPAVSVHESLDLPVWAHTFWKDQPNAVAPDIAHKVSPSPNRSMLSPVESDLTTGVDENGARRRSGWGPKQTSEDLAQVQLYNMSKEMKAVNNAILSELQNDMSEQEIESQAEPQSRDVPLLGSVSRQSAANLRSMAENMSMKRTDE